MAHGIMEFDTLAYNDRKPVWHGLGTPVSGTMSSTEALEIAGLDWKVEPQPIFINFNGKKIEVPNTIANVNQKNGLVLGVVTEKYNILQNQDAFSFLDSIVGKELQFETAGSLFNTKTVWMLAKMPNESILDEDYEHYLVITNSHDGKGSIKIADTVTRVCCANTLNYALKNAPRMWSTKHMGDINTKKAEAVKTLNLAHNYVSTLRESAEVLVNKKFTEKQFKTFVEVLLPTDGEESDRQVKNIEFQRNELSEIFHNAPDLENFRFTQWGLLGAVSDFATHKNPLRATDTFQERQFNRVLNGHPIMDKAYELIQSM